MADKNPTQVDEQDLEPIGEAHGQSAEDDLVPLGEVDAAGLPPAVAVEQQVEESEARKSVEQARRVSTGLSDSGALGAYLASRAELAEEALHAGHLDVADLAGQEVVALVEAYRRLHELDRSRRSRAKQHAEYARKTLVDEVQQIFDRGIHQILGGAQLGDKIRAVASEVTDTAVGRAVARLGGELGELRTTFDEVAQRHAEAAVSGAEERVAEIARREARESDRTTWNEHLGSKELADKIKGAARTVAQEIAKAAATRLETDLRAAIAEKIDQTIAANLGGRELSEMIVDVSGARAKEIIADREKAILNEVDQRNQKTTEELNGAIKRIDLSAEAVASFARREIAKIRTQVTELESASGGEDADELRAAVESTGNLVKEEIKRFGRELKTMRSRISESQADFKAEIEKIRVFAKAEIDRLDEALEEARQIISEKAAQMDESSVRKIVQKLVKEKKEKEDK